MKINNLIDSERNMAQTVSHLKLNPNQDFKIK